MKGTLVGGNRECSMLTVKPSVSKTLTSDFPISPNGGNLDKCGYWLTQSSSVQIQNSQDFVDWLILVSCSTRQINNYCFLYKWQFFYQNPASRSFAIKKNYTTGRAFNVKFTNFFQIQIYSETIWALASFLVCQLSRIHTNYWKTAF